MLGLCVAVVVVCGDVIGIVCVWLVVVAYGCGNCGWFLLFSAMSSVVMKMSVVCCSSSGVVCILCAAFVCGLVILCLGAVACGCICFDACVIVDLVCG